MKKFILGLGICSVMLATPAFAFSDVPLNFWGYDRIEEMHKSGVINGFEDGTFRPNEKITREQVATIFTSFFELKKEEGSKKFEDVKEGYWSEEYNEIVSPYMPFDEKDGKYYFRPMENATRIEIAKTVFNILGLETNDEELKIIDTFNDKESFNEEDKQYIALIASKGIMIGDDKGNFRPNDTITRAEFCSMIYNIYLTKNDLKEQELDKTLMTINGQKISKNEFNMYFKLQKKVYESMLGKKDIWDEEIDGKKLYDIVKDATKEALISEKVKVQEAKKLGIKLTVENENELENYANSDVGKEICEFYDITSEELYKINSEGMLVSELAKKNYETMDHTGHNHIDITKPIDNVRYDARHILIMTEGMKEEEKAKAKEKAEELLKKVLDGEDFAKLANENSADGGSNKNGGLYEHVGLGEFVPEFEKAALALEEGTICPTLVESDYGYHIIKLEKKEKVQEEVSKEKKQEIMNKDLEEVAKEWVKNAKVEVKDSVYKEI